MRGRMGGRDCIRPILRERDDRSCGGAAWPPVYRGRVESGFCGAGGKPDKAGKREMEFIEQERKKMKYFDGIINLKDLVEEMRK